MKGMKTGGRLPRVKDILRAQELRAKGVTIRGVSWIILKREDPKTIYRWLKVDPSKLSPTKD